jgi:Na+-translocating ferredoxin:NAD+ oxidoreductase RnfD subunit
MLKEKLYVSSSPHFRGHNSTTRIMGDVLIALVPALSPRRFCSGFVFC